MKCPKLCVEFYTKIVYHQFYFLVILKIPTQGAKRRKEVLSCDYLEVCMYVRNIVTVILRNFHFNWNFRKYQINFYMSWISRTSEGGRPNASNIATTTEYCPWVGPSVGFAHAAIINSISSKNLTRFILLNFWRRNYNIFLCFP